MNTTFQLDHDASMLRVIQSGEPSYSDFCKMSDAIADTCLKYNVQNILLSITQNADALDEISQNEIENYAKYQEQFRSLLLKLRIAIFSTDPMALGLVRMWASITKSLDIPIHIGVFFEECDAIEWLSLRKQA